MDVTRSNMSYVPTDNFHDYLFSNTDVYRRFIFPESRVIFEDPATEQSLTFARLRDDSLRVAQSLAKLVAHVPAKDDFGVPGAIVGPVVLLHLPNSLMFPVIFLGALAAKCTVSLASPASSPSELAYVMELVRPDIAFTQPGELGEDIFRKTFPLLSKGCTKPRLFTVDVSHYPTNATIPRYIASSTWLNLLNTDASYRVHPMSAHEQAHRVAVILWSSGTTGKSKGVMHSHRGLVTSNVLWQKHAINTIPNEVWIGLPPFYHIMGLQVVCLLAPLYGAKVLVMRKFDLETYLRLVSKHRVTALSLAPPLALAITKTPLLAEPWCDFSSVRSAGCGAAPLGPDIIREFHRRTGVPILMGYGLSETGCFTHRPDITWESAERHLGYSGRIMSDVDIKIVDELGNPLPSGKSGEILMRSNLQMIGYLRNPRANAETFTEDGFIRTGDVGLIDKDRYIKIVDRIKDLIKYNGFQVAPVELDAVIGALSSVLDVGVTSLYSDAEQTELPIAYVVPRSPELVQVIMQGQRNDPRLHALAAQIFKTVEGQCAYYKWLRGGIVFCEAITKSPTGKILRRSLKDIRGIHVGCISRATVRARL